jgi:hypothetical protein
MCEKGVARSGHKSDGIKRAQRQKWLGEKAMDFAHTLSEIASWHRTNTALTKTCINVEDF